MISGRQTTAGLGSAVAVLNLETRKYYTMEGTALRIWETLNEPQTVRDLMKKLVKRYEVDPDRCREDVLAFLEELVANGLVEAGRQQESGEPGTGIARS